MRFRCYERVTEHAKKEKKIDENCKKKNKQYHEIKYRVASLVGILCSSNTSGQMKIVL